MSADDQNMIAMWKEINKLRDEINRMKGIPQINYTSGTWNPSMTGFTTDPTGPTGFFSYILIGKLCIAMIYMSSNVTSNQTYFTCTAPFTCASTNIWGGTNWLAMDNSVTLTVATKWQLTGSSNVINFYTNMGTGVWTAGNNKRASCVCVYQVA